jgi:hypothetical protein
MHLLLWKKASQHHLGQGLEEGVDLTVVKHELSKLHKSQRSDEAGMLATIVVAGMWTEYRILEGRRSAIM